MLSAQRNITVALSMALLMTAIAGCGGADDSQRTRAEQDAIQRLQNIPMTPDVDLMKASAIEALTSGDATKKKEVAEKAKEELEKITPPDVTDIPKDCSSLLSEVKESSTTGAPLTDSQMQRVAECEKTSPPPKKGEKVKPERVFAAILLRMAAIVALLEGNPQVAIALFALADKMDGGSGSGEGSEDASGATSENSGNNPGEQQKETLAGSQSEEAKQFAKSLQGNGLLEGTSAGDLLVTLGENGKLTFFHGKKGQEVGTFDASSVEFWASNPDALPKKSLRAELIGGQLSTYEYVGRDGQMYYLTNETGTPNVSRASN